MKLARENVNVTPIRTQIKEFHIITFYNMPTKYTFIVFDFAIAIKYEIGLIYSHLYLFANWSKFIN